MPVRGRGNALDGGSLRTLDPFSVDEKAGVDGNLTFEKIVVELVGEYARHGEESKERRMGRGGRRRGA